MEHQGHRNRLKERYLKEGLSGFAEHEILELLLFFVQPRKDTNIIAHRLIDRFGSLRGVLTADYEALLEVPGVGAQTALMLTLLPHISERFALSGRDLPRFITAKDAADSIVPILENLPEEQMHIYCLDMSYRLIAHDIVATGNVSALPVHLTTIVRFCVRSNAARVILAHNHPGGSANPSRADIELTKELVEMLRVVNIRLADHIIASQNSYYSFATGGLIKDMRADDGAMAAQYANRDI